MSARQGEIPTPTTLVGSCDTAPEYRSRSERPGLDPRVEQSQRDVGRGVQRDVDDHHVGGEAEQHRQISLDRRLEHELAEAPDPSQAQRFVDFLLSAEAVEVLDARGFTRP